MDDGGSFAEHALDLTVRVGPPCDTVARLRRMFNGQGIFCDGVMFALVADDTLYLKGDDDMKPAFLDAGSSPFTYEKVRGEIELPPRRSRRGCREITRLGPYGARRSKQGPVKEVSEDAEKPSHRAATPVPE
jgi:hypothetical protein